MATHYNIPAWKIPWIEVLGGLHCSWGCKRAGHDLVTTATTYMFSDSLPLQFITRLLTLNIPQYMCYIYSRSLLFILHSSTSIDHISPIYPFSPFKPLGNHKFVFYVCLNELICITFKDSTYICPLTYFTYYDNLQVYPSGCKRHYFILFYV